MAIQHVVTRPRQPWTDPGTGLEIHQVPAWHDNLIWLLVDRARGTAAAVDGPEASGVLDYCAARDLNLTTVLNTHTHRDHVGINMDLARRGLLDAMTVIGPSQVAAKIPGLTVGVADGDTITFGDAQGEVLLTEGHIDGHVSYLIGEALFCGDTMFGAGCGYLFDGPPSKMYRSLQRLAELPDETLVCCAHEYTQDNLRFAWSVEPDNSALAARIRETWTLRRDGGSSVPSTMGVERATNPFLRGDSLSLRAAVAAAMGDDALTDGVALFAATRALKDTKAYRSISDEALPTA